MVSGIAYVIGIEGSWKYMHPSASSSNYEVPMQRLQRRYRSLALQLSAMIVHRSHSVTDPSSICLGSRSRFFLVASQYSNIFNALTNLTSNYSSHSMELEELYFVVQKIAAESAAILSVWSPKGYSDKGDGKEGTGLHTKRL
ncbi:hypothetical protein PTI98_005832 [Pleurotus ostreatus]|nr:hypothetical protein PTI98_005832 [Pleurotus ostreatus]